VGYISVADCMPLSNLLKTIKINGGIECRLCMTTAQLITAGQSPENNTAMTYHRVVDLCHKQESTDAWWAMHQWILFIR